MWAPRGSVGKLGDVDVVSHDGELHLFHLALPSHDVVGHAISRDGLGWRSVATALSTGAPGEPDDHMIWTCGVIRRDTDWLMLYTALATAEGGRVQRVCAATSTDLAVWTKRGIVSEAEPRWYSAGTTGAPWVSWRDPKITLVDGERWATVCARTTAGPAGRRGAVAVIRERDGGWEPGPPLYQTSRFSELECPQLFSIGGRWYLTAAVLDDRSQRYWISESGPTGPWRTPAQPRLLPDGHYAARVVRHDSRDAIFCWHEPPGAAHGTDLDRRYVPSPLVLAVERNGDLRVEPWPLWETRRGPEARLELDLARRLAGRAERRNDSFAAPPGSSGLFHLGALPTAFDLRFELRLDAALVGLGLGVDDATLGTWLELDRADRRARLVCTAPPRGTDAPWLERRVLQEAPLPVDAPVELRIRSSGELEVAYAGAVILSTAAPNRAGDLVLLVDDGEATLRDARWAPLDLESVG